MAKRVLVLDNQCVVERIDVRPHNKNVAESTEVIRTGRIEGGIANAASVNPPSLLGRKINIHFILSLASLRSEIGDRDDAITPHLLLNIHQHALIVSQGHRLLVIVGDRR